MSREPGSNRTRDVLVFAASALLIGVSVYAFRRHDHRQIGSAGHSAVPSDLIPAPNPTATTRTASTNARSAKALSALPPNAPQIDFSALPAETNVKQTNGQLTYMRGAIPVGPLAGVSVETRAREIVDQLVAQSNRTDVQLGAAVVSKVGDASQVFFPQTSGGLSLYPPRGVSVLIDAPPDAEAILSGLDANFSDSVPMPAGTAPAGGNGIVYIERKGGQVVSRYATRTTRDGIDTITDANTGKVILRANKRQY